MRNLRCSARVPGPERQATGTGDDGGVSDGPPLSTHDMLTPRAHVPCGAGMQGGQRVRDQLGQHDRPQQDRRAHAPAALWQDTGMAGGRLGPLRLSAWSHVPLAVLSSSGRFGTAKASGCPATSLQPRVLAYRFPKPPLASSSPRSLSPSVSTYVLASRVRPPLSSYRRRAGRVLRCTSG